MLEAAVHQKRSSLETKRGVRTFEPFAVLVRVLRHRWKNRKSVIMMQYSVDIAAIGNRMTYPHRQARKRAQRLTGETISFPATPQASSEEIEVLQDSAQRGVF